MLVAEWYKILKSKKSVLFIIILFIIPFIDLIMNFHSCYADYYKYPEAYGNVLKASMILHPSKASFLAASSEGHLPQILFIWILPMYIMIIYADLYISEKKFGNRDIYITNIGRNGYFYNKFIMSFIVPFIIILLSLSVNFGFANILFKRGTSFLGLEQIRGEIADGFLQWAIQYPHITYILYIISFSFIAGCCGLACMGITILFGEYKTVYPISFFVWFIQFIPLLFSSDITAAIQPFTEYGINEIFIAYGIWMPIVFSVIILAKVFKVNKDVL